MRFQRRAWLSVAWQRPPLSHAHAAAQLMGPSGSGKSSLLNALASHTPVTKSMTLAGVLRINGVPPARSGVRVGYVQQHDMFYSQMTVLETLDMVAALRLPQQLAPAARDAAVAEVVQKLDLGKVLHTVVGDRKTRGVSGGEKKRLSIACELLTKPSLLFLDEPTTGLDAFQALQVCARAARLLGVCKRVCECRAAERGEAEWLRTLRAHACAAAVASLRNIMRRAERRASKAHSRR